MIQILCDISNEKHKELMEWLYNKCDKFTFVIPNFSKTVDLFSNNISNENFIYEEQTDFIKYKTQVDAIISPIRKHVIMQKHDIKYCGFINNYEKEILILTLNKETKDFLIKTNNLFSWIFPNMPEDVCFFNENKCFLRSVAHEKMIFIYNDSIETQKKLQEIGIDFSLCIDEEIPTI